MQRETQGVISVFEAEHLVRGLENLPLESVGSDKWMQQHDVIEKLNIQAHHDAITQHDEFVLEAILSEDKIPVLIHELLVIELWKDKVFPLLKSKIDRLTSIKAYIVLYHEATICNLLEVLLYHQRVCESAEDSLTELVDYCARKLIVLNSGVYSDVKSNCGDEDTENDKPNDTSSANISEEERTLNKYVHDIGFSVCVCAVSMLRFITDHTPALPLSLVTRILDSHDIILSLVPLIENPPWTRRNDKGEVEKFVDQKWGKVAPSDVMKLTKTEAQVWLSIYNLIMENTCRQKYQYNTHRKEIIIKLRRHFNELLLDQIPMLRDLQRCVEELQLMDPPAPTQSSLVVIEQIPEMRESLLQSNSDFSSIANKQMRSVFSNDPSQRQKDVVRLAQTYNLDNYDDVLEDPVCAAPGCGEVATKRCSKCKSEWYCSRECQVSAWGAHKPICAVLTAHQQSTDKTGAAVSVASSAPTTASAGQALKPVRNTQNNKIVVVS